MAAESVECTCSCSSAPISLARTTIAALLGDPTVPKDWGGEQSDLFTMRFRTAGRSHSAAFMFKGPAGGSMWKPMTIGMLGKNGDQLQRLASPAEVLVLQHCHEIRPEVISMLESLTSDMRNVRRFMVIDGYHTYALMQAARALPQHPLSPRTQTDEHDIP